MVGLAGFPDLRRLMQLALTISVANVAAERSFPRMRKIPKNVCSKINEGGVTERRSISSTNLSITEKRHDFCSEFPDQTRLYHLVPADGVPCL